jgi:cell surface protein SprA
MAAVAFAENKGIHIAHLLKRSLEYSANSNMSLPLRAISEGKLSNNMENPLITIFPTPLPLDSIPNGQNRDSLRYPFNDSPTDFQQGSNVPNPFNLQPSGVQENIEYDPATGTYILTQTLNGQVIGVPQQLSFDEYWDKKQQDMQTDYWGTKSAGGSVVQGQGLIPKLYQGSELFDDIFGPGGIDIRPTGSISQEIGFQYSRTDNPNNLNSRRVPVQFMMGQPDINIGVVGKIGDKLKLNLNYDTKAVFDFNNQIKLEYVGSEDEILQEIRAGNVNFPLPVSLIPGSQNLFGVQAKLKFGRLTLNTVLSQQKSRAKAITLQNGAQTQEFRLSADQYDESRHFFLAQYFRDNYEKALAGLPYINSPITITRLDVYVNDTRGNAEDVQRNIVGFADLGEYEPFNENTIGDPTRKLPENASNNLYQKLLNDASVRILDNVATQLNNPAGNFQLKNTRDYFKTLARKLDPDEYTYDPQLGFVSLNFQLRPNEVLAVYYEYTTNSGGRYEVGETSERFFSENNDSDPRVLFLKMLKPNTENPKLPMWDLMMKNVYALGAYQVNQQDFKFDIYYDQPNSGDIRYIPEGNDIKGIPLIQLLRLDRLNTNQEPYRDGVFDFIDSRRDFDAQSSTLQNNVLRYGTINSKTGRIYFPVLEPFGGYLQQKFADGGNDETTAKKFVYTQLYDSTRTVAGDFAQYNRFILKGSYKSSVSSEISLGAFNIPQGSVRVNAGGAQLTEGVDYTIDYNLGRLTVLNEAYINSGSPLQISFEDNGAFGIQQRNYMGMRADYTINKDFNLGATWVQLGERPFTQKVNYGENPIKNMMVGADGNYFKETPWITRLLDKLPFYSTKEPSSVRITGEVAGFIPGHSGAIDNTQCGDNGAIYVDDFEGSKSETDLSFPLINWMHSSTPNNGLFPEASLSNDLAYGYNRAQISWYQIDQFLYSNRVGDIPQEVRDFAAENPYERRINQAELFPNRNTQLGQGVLNTFCVAYFPNERGPYNFNTEPYIDNNEVIAAGINNNPASEDCGKLLDPASRWGGLMRDSPYKNFESANIEFIEFWLLDPFIDNPNTPENESNNAGDMYFNLGNVSEDVLRDSRQAFENGLYTSSNLNSLDSTAWGFSNSLRPPVDAFNNNLETRRKQDVGYDGTASTIIDNRGEEILYKGYKDYIANLRGQVTLPEVTARLDSVLNDISGDDFAHYRANYQNNAATLTERYKHFNGPEGNSPDIQTNDTLNYTSSASGYPNKEDYNDNNSLDDAESFFEYKLRLYKDMQVGDEDAPYLADIRKVTHNNNDENWYYFRIPVNKPTNKIGEINFRNIEGIRMFLTDFEKPVVCRMAEFNLVRNNWRRYPSLILEEGEYLPDDNAENSFFAVTAVSIEESGNRRPISYKMPACIKREQVVGSAGQATVQLNEQAMSLQVADLRDGESKAAYKRVDMDMRQFKRLKAFVHAESLAAFESYCDPLQSDEVSIFLRVGDDFKENYYEYEISLSTFQPTEGDYDYGADSIWLKANNIDIALDDWVDLKLKRNFDPLKPPAGKPYTRDTTINGKRIRWTVVGSPDLGRVKQMMVGVRNPKRTSATRLVDDGNNKCAEVWINELRLTDPTESAGWAGLARMDIKLADLGNFTLSSNMHTAGFGTLEQRIQDRAQDNYIDVNAAANLELGKLLPNKANIRIPTYANISTSVSTPKYDPYDTDVILKENIDSIRLYHGADSARLARKQRQTAATIKNINFTNVRKERGKDKKNSYPWDIENVNLSYAYTETELRDPVIEKNLEKKHVGSIGYTYSTRPIYIEPFRKLIKSNSPYLKLIKEFNFNLVPSSFSFRTDLNRRVGTLLLRPLSIGEIIDPIYQKQFLWKRTYGLKYNPTRSIAFDFNATNNSVIDEPQDGKTPADTIWHGLRTGGRVRGYQHDASLSYNLPLDKLPLLSWLQVRTRYGGGYFWRTSQIALSDTLGHLIGNNQNIQINGEMNFTKIYNSIPFLKKINTPPVYKKKPVSTSKDKSKDMKSDKDADKATVKASKEKNKKGKNRKDKVTDEKEAEKTAEEIAETEGDAKGNEKDKDKGKNKDKGKDKDKDKDTAAKTDKKASGGNSGDVSPVARFFVRPLLSLRRISFTYNERNNTEVPGYTLSPKYIGETWENTSGGPRPGLDFAFGYQPKLKQWLEWAASDNLISDNTNITEQVKQSRDVKMDLKVNLEPFRDFKIDLSANLNQTRNHTQFYKVADDGDNAFKHLSNIDVGSYSISYLGINTLFDSINSDSVSTTFSTFQNIRPLISQRFATEYANVNNGEILGEYTDPLNNDTLLAGYAQGYGPYSQNVLLPAFLAAYSGRDPNKISLNPFASIPMPNWRISYNGLSKLPLFSGFLTNFNITHAYTNTLSINNYRNSLAFDYRYFDEALLLMGDPAIVDYLVQERLRLATQGDLDTLTNNFVPYLQIPSVIISEQLAPLIGVDLGFKNGITARFEYKKSRMLSMSFQDYQLNETRTEEFVIGAGFRVKDLKLPLKIMGKQIELQNELVFNCDFSLRDNSTTNYRLDQGTADPINGSKTIRLAPTIDYTVSQKLRVALFYEYTRNIPKTSNAFPSVNMRGGLRVSLTL